jgi:PhzF family phenazine biosynthesis protein
MTPKVYSLRVFAVGPNGGNPLPVVVDAQGMSDAEMQAVAASHGHESGFVIPAPKDSNYDFQFVFWVPEHEMEMCGHATVGTIWLLEKLDRLPKHDDIRVLTKSGMVDARVSKNSEGTWIEISQPQGIVQTLTTIDVVEELASILGISIDELASVPIQNSKTSRVKTLIQLKSVEQLNALKPQFHRIKQICEAIGSTGLYPYAISDEENQIVSARQFPKSSGYNEDAATGIAAAALAYGLLENGLVKYIDKPITVRQGWAMGCPSEISVRFRQDAEGCWIGGTAVDV